MSQVKPKTRPDYMQIAKNLYGGGVCKTSTANTGIYPRAEKQHSDINTGASPRDENDDLKSEILATRKGGFGSSDASMIIDIATTGKIYKTEHLKRLAVFEGLIEPDNFTNKYMEAGNQREKEIFDADKMTIKCIQFTDGYKKVCNPVT